MQTVFNRPSILVAVFALLFGGAFNPIVGVAQDTEYHYTFHPDHLIPMTPDPLARFQYAHSAAGEIIDLHTSYNETQEVLTFDMTLGNVTDPAQMPQLFSLTIRPAAQSGSSTRITGGDRGRFATLYFDVSAGGLPKISVYSFSGNENEYDYKSYRGQYVGPAPTPCPAGASCHTADGNVYTLPDQICTTEGGDTCGVISRSFTDNGDGTANYSFAVSTTAINSHVINTFNQHHTFGWDGMRFNWELGYLISFLGYQNLVTSYDGNGFLQNVTFNPVQFIPGACEYAGEKSCPAGYQTLIFGKEFQTAQPLFCEDVQSSPSPVFVGHEFTASATAVSRTGQGLQVFYFGAPTGSNFTPADGHIEPADPDNNPPFGEPGYDIFDKEEPIPTVLTAGVSYTPTIDDLGQSFSIDMIFRDTFSDFMVTCPVSFFVQDPPLCTEFDIFSLQISLDSQAELQRRQVQRITQRFFGLARGTEHIQRARRTRRNLRRQASELFDQSWALIWIDIPSTITQCEESPFCVQVSNVDRIVGYQENAEQFLVLTRRANRRMNRFLGRGAPRIVNRATNFRDVALNEVNNFPTSFSTCDFEELE